MQATVLHCPTQHHCERPFLTLTQWTVLQRLLRPAKRPQRSLQLREAASRCSWSGANLSRAPRRRYGGGGGLGIIVLGLLWGSPRTFCERQHTA